MKKHLKNLLTTVAIPSIFIAGFSNTAFAININPEIANIGYWYDDSGAMCKVVYVIVWQL
jgi:hypothetical protein